jgi:HSP20 family molecular chaperone IbpA
MRNDDPGVWMLADAVKRFDEIAGVNAEYFWLDQFDESLYREPPRWEPSVDIYRDKDKLGLLMELPGVTSKSLEISLERASLILRGERLCSASVGADAVLRQEICYGRFERRITLPYTDYLIFDMQLEAGLLRLHLERLS